MKDGTCEYWTNWSDPLSLGRDAFVVKWIFYIAWAVSTATITSLTIITSEISLFQTCFAGTCAFLVKHFAPYAAGSGISEIKCILGKRMLH
jgi:hypothetical protein